MKLFLIILLFTACNTKNRKVIFINQSDFKIDSVKISISSADVYNVKFDNINLFDTVTNEIPFGMPMSNKHDITIFISIFIKNMNPINSYSYNDLSGDLTNDYLIKLDKNNKVIWRMPQSKYY